MCVYLCLCVCLYFAVCVCLPSFRFRARLFFMRSTFFLAVAPDKVLFLYHPPPAPFPSAHPYHCSLACRCSLYSVARLWHYVWQLATLCGFAEVFFLVSLKHLKISFLPVPLPWLSCLSPCRGFALLWVTFLAPPLATPCAPLSQSCLRPTMFHKFKEALSSFCCALWKICCLWVSLLRLPNAFLPPLLPAPCPGWASLYVCLVAQRLSSRLAAHWRPQTWLIH